MRRRFLPNFSWLVPAAAALGMALAAGAVWLYTGSLLAASLAGAAGAAAAAAAALVPLATSLRDLAAIWSRDVPSSASTSRGAPYFEIERLREAAAAGLERAAGESAQAATDSRLKLTAALDAVADAVLCVSRDGRVCFANQAMAALLSAHADELLGVQPSSVLPNVDFIEALRRSNESRMPERVSILAGNRRNLDVAIQPVDIGDWTTIVAVRDLTEVRRTEQMRRDFVANVSHELRTPLASIRAVLETLEDGALADTSTARDFVARAGAEVDRLSRLTAELLELSRIEAGAEPLVLEVCDIGSAVCDATERLRSQAQRAGITLSTEIAPRLPAVRGDVERLERAVMNLVENAIKFSHDGGNVWVTAREAGGEVAISIRDTGVGIDSRELPRIFERFYKTDDARRSGGSGLGLAIVKHTIEAHGGTVSVESEHGGGSTFTIRLPAAHAVSAATKEGDT